MRGLAQPTVSFDRPNHSEGRVISISPIPRLCKNTLGSGVKTVKYNTEKKLKNGNSKKNENENKIGLHFYWSLKIQALNNLDISMNSL